MAKLMPIFTVSWPCAAVAAASAALTANTILIFFLNIFVPSAGERIIVRSKPSMFVLLGYVRIGQGTRAIQARVTRAAVLPAWNSPLALLYPGRAGNPYR